MGRVAAQNPETGRGPGDVAGAWSRWPVAGAIVRRPARAGHRPIGSVGPAECPPHRGYLVRMAASSDSAASRDPTTRGAASRRSLITWRLLSALFLLAMGGIHLYLVFHGTGGILGILFTLNFVGGLVLAVAMVVTRGRLLPVASVLSLLFLVGTLLALVLALTVGLFGIRSSLDYDLAPTTLVVESIGTIVLAVTTAVVLRARRGG